MRNIPVSVAERVAKKHGYDQVIIIARKVDTDEKKGGEHMTTYGINKTHCDIIAKAGKFLQEKVMQWMAAEKKCDNCEYFKADYGTHCVNGWSKDGSTGTCGLEPEKIPAEAASACSHFNPR